MDLGLTLKGQDGAQGAEPLRSTRSSQKRDSIRQQCHEDAVRVCNESGILELRRTLQHVAQWCSARRLLLMLTDITGDELQAERAALLIRLWLFDQQPTAEQVRPRLSHALRWGCGRAWDWVELWQGLTQTCGSHPAGDLISTRNQPRTISHSVGAAHVASGTQ